MERPKAEIRYKRRNYFIKKGFQARFILRFILVIFLGIMVSSGIVYYLTSKRIEEAYYRSHIKIASTGEIVYPILIAANIVTVSIIIVITIIITLLISHKIAGPLYRIEKSIHEIGEGNLSFKIYLRAKDELITLAEIFNNMIAKLRGKIEKMQDAAHHMGSTVNQWAIIKKIDKKALSKDVTAIRKRVNEIEKVIATFKLKK
ncbi:MAG: HAMP domain-containing protein [Nitrospirae bacterium]|nr:HAMP domain-containing protein [Nitrospirota bacterium]